MGLEGDILQAVTFFVRLFLPAEKVEVQLGDLKQADVVVGIQAWIKLDVIFHKGVYYW